MKVPWKTILGGESGFENSGVVVHEDAENNGSRVDVT